jgi:hypothetical protein
MLAKIIVAILRAVRKSRYSASGISQDYLAMWTQAASDLASGNLTKAEFLAVMEVNLNDYGEDVYQHSAGMSYALDDDDAKTIQEFVTLQMQYVEGFANDVITAGALTQALVDRLRLWAESLAALGAVAYITAHPNQSGEWRLGATEKHCPDCTSLNGTIQTLQWYLDNGYIPGQPGSPGLACGGWQCDCGIYDTVTGRRLLPLVKLWHKVNTI